VYVDRVALPSTGTLATKDFLGTVALNSGRGVLSAGGNPNNVEVGFDNTNTAGITTASVANAATASAGIELRIPFADLGLAPDFAGTVALTAFIERVDGAISNQWLPALPAGSGDLGIAPNANNIAGAQHLTVFLGAIADLNGDGSVNGSDLGILLGNWGPTPPGSGIALGDLNRDGIVDGADLGRLLAQWGTNGG
jgi:hypothetical protein